MWAALFWGGISGSAVLVGAIAAMLFPIKKRVSSCVMAFGTGVLTGAAAYELLGESVKSGGIPPTGTGFLLGAVVFTILDLKISAKGAAKRKRSHSQNSAQKAGLAIFIGTTMDAIPESIMVGASLLTENGVSFLLVIAIFISNVPEGLSSTTGLLKSGYTRKKIFLLWLAVFAVSAFSAWAGYFFLGHASEALLAGIAAFAAGGIIAMVGSTMMPEAFEGGGPVVGLLAAIGLFVSLLLHHFS